MDGAGDRADRHLVLLAERLPLEGGHVFPFGGHIVHGEAYIELHAVGLGGDRNIPADLHGCVIFGGGGAGLEAIGTGRVCLWMVAAIAHIGDIPMVGVVAVPFLVGRDVTGQLGLALLGIVDAVGDVAHADIADISQGAGVQRVLLEQLLPRLGVVVTVGTLTHLDVDMLRDLQITVRGGGHVIVQRAVAEVGRIAERGSPDYRQGDNCQHHRGNNADDSGANESYPHVFPLLRQYGPGRRLTGRA